MGANVQSKFQQVPAGNPQNGPAVRLEVPHKFQFARQLVRRFQAGEQDHIVDFPGLSILLINGTDLSGNEEPGLHRLTGHLARKAELRTQTVKPLFRRDKLLPKLLPPGGMGKIPSAQQSDAFFPRPKIQMGQVAVTAGGSGISGMNVQIGVKHSVPPGLFFPL